MTAIFFEILLIILLVAANGIFAMSEMAVVSSRKARLQQSANEGDEKALAALALAESPDRFLSTVQIGITLVGILAGAFGGATIAEQISVRVSAAVPAVAPYGDAIGLFIVVLAITFLSLVFGELVPKRFALHSPEKIAAFVARPMNLLSKFTAPFVYLLSFSSNIVFKIFGLKPSDEPPITEEEIKVLIEQGTQAGVFAEAEQDLVESVFRLADRRVAVLMTPRREIVWLDAADSAGEIQRKISESHYSRFPVCEGAVDNVIGVVKAKEYLAAILTDEKTSLQEFIKQPLFVPETTTALQTLESFKTLHTHIAFVIDEHGTVEGLVTTNDLLEAIVGDIVPLENEDEAYAVRREDGSWLIDGALPIDDFKDIFSIRELSGEKKGSYQTVAGFVLTFLGHIPAPAEHFEANGLKIEIVDMDGNRIDKLLVTPAEQISD